MESKAWRVLLVAALVCSVALCQMLLHFILFNINSMPENVFGWREIQQDPRVAIWSVSCLSLSNLGFRVSFFALVGNTTYLLFHRNFIRLGWNTISGYCVSLIFLGLVRGFMLGLLAIFYWEFRADPKINFNIQAIFLADLGIICYCFALELLFFVLLTYFTRQTIQGPGVERNDRNGT